ncbi:20770_t:CDS:1, partial [Gigaspora margarita]
VAAFWCFFVSSLLGVAIVVVVSNSVLFRIDIFEADSSLQFCFVGSDVTKLPLFFQEIGSVFGIS